MPRWCAGTCTPSSPVTWPNCAPSWPGTWKSTGHAPRYEAGFLARRAVLEQEHGPEDQHCPGERQHALPEAQRDQEDAQAEVEDAAGNSHSYPEARVTVFPRPDQEPGEQGPRGRAIRCIHDFLLDTRCRP